MGSLYGRLAPKFKISLTVIPSSTDSFSSERGRKVEEGEDGVTSGWDLEENAGTLVCPGDRGSILVGSRVVFSSTFRYDSSTL